MMDSPWVTSALVATGVKVTGLPESRNACCAPSMRGWMLSWPGVAMNAATSPESTWVSARRPSS
jgi:hypothetical protein